MASLTVPACPQLSTPTSKHTDDDLRQEVLLLKGEVEKLTSNNQLLEAELEKTTKEHKEAKAIAADEAEKSKAAKEVIRTLTAQLKEMTEEAMEKNKTSCRSGFPCGQSSGGKKEASHDDHLTSLLPPTSESNMRTMDAMLNNGAKAQPEKTEYVVQEEPGVYITLRSLPGGGNELKRMHFSRKQFSQEQAQNWWAENSKKVYERLPSLSFHKLPGVPLILLM